KILIVNPELGDEYRDRGLLLHKLECHNAALNDLSHYLNVRPEAKDNDAIRDLVIDLQKNHARLN
ncbi:MAG: tetratricopeptide repeat protein, partial [Gammaproteobacteria bacterium]